MFWFRNRHIVTPSLLFLLNRVKFIRLTYINNNQKRIFCFVLFSLSLTSLSLSLNHVHCCFACRCTPIFAISYLENLSKFTLCNRILKIKRKLQSFCKLYINLKWLKEKKSNLITMLEHLIRRRNYSKKMEQ